ncbi:MAG: YlxR family protein [Caldimicrobium sp.]|nr:YlxR family protein [Caldimicrobium sp.]MDW8182734.1 YlxR family protein [Caldimicrobium sp.]
MPKAGHLPERTCVSCRKKLPKVSMIRFAKMEGQIILDETQRLPGRGAYLCRDCFSILKSKKTTKKLEKALWRTKGVSS